VIPIELPADAKSEALMENLQSVLPDPGSTTYSKVVVINFWPVEAIYLPYNVENVKRCQELTFMSSLQALKFLMEAQPSSIISDQLVVVSCCAQFITGDEDDVLPWASTAWGLCRTACLEVQKIRTMIIDLGKADSTETDLLVREIRVRCCPIH
jgi:hypothetical protein